MNRIKVNITRQDASQAKSYLYQVMLDGQQIYLGKVFMMKQQTTATVDLTDILSDYQYAGQGILTPTWADNQYKQPQAQETPLNGNERHYDRIIINWYDNNVQQGTLSANVYFHTIPFNAESMQRKIGNNVTYYFGKLIPRMPKLHTKNLRYGQLINSGNMIAPVWISNRNTTYTFNRANGSRVIAIDLHRFETDNVNVLYSSDNGLIREILRLDNCPAPYYLCWTTSNGGFQCQPFTGASQYTEESNRNTKVSVDDMTDIANSQINGKWQLKSYNLTDAEYNEYMDITRSQYLLLYDTNIDVCTSVKLGII